MPLDSTNYDIGQRDDVLDLLRRVRNRIAQPGGWCQGKQHDERGAVCMLGAIHYCENGGNTVAGRLRLHVAWQSLRALAPGNDAIGYNDAPGRTQAEVVALVDRAIAKLGGGR